MFVDVIIFFLVCRSYYYIDWKVMAFRQDISRSGITQRVQEEIHLPGDLGHGETHTPGIEDLIASNTTLLVN